MSIEILHDGYLNVSMCDGYLNFGMCDGYLNIESKEQIITNAFELIILILFLVLTLCRARMYCVQ